MLKRLLEKLRDNFGRLNIWCINSNSFYFWVCSFCLYSSKQVLVGSFRAHEKRRFFREDQSKETTFQSKLNENSQNFSKNHQKKNHKPKKKHDHDGSSKKVKEKGEKNSSLFCKVFKKTNHNAEKYWYKCKPNLTFVKQFEHMKIIVGKSNTNKKNFCKE